MSQETVEITQRWIGAYNRRDLDGLIGLTDPDVVLDNSNAAFDGAVYRGHDGVRDWSSWVEGMWKRQELKPQGFIPVGDSQVIAPVLLVSVGRDDVETVAQGAAVVTVREEKVTRLKTFQSRAEALKAVGLSEREAAALSEQTLAPESTPR